jgi:hypothetical protein
MHANNMNKRDERGTTVLLLVSGQNSVGASLSLLRFFAIALYHTSISLSPFVPAY